MRNNGSFIKKTMLVALGLSLLAFTGCTCTKNKKSSEIATADPDAPKIFHYFRSSSHKSLDPMKQFDSASAEIVANVYDTLLEYHYLKRPYELIPGLLDRMPEQQPDGLTYLFTLRKGVKFHDNEAFPDKKGREVTADDIIYTLKRFADINVNLKSFMLIEGMVEGLDDFRAETKKAGKNTNYDELDISGIKKVDTHSVTIKFTLDSHLTLFPFAFSGMSIIPREAVEKYGDEFENNPVGTGPFYIKEYSRRGKIVLARNPDYFGTYPTAGAKEDIAAGLLDDAGKQLPFLDEVHLPLIEESQPAMLKFLRGEIDWIGMNKDDFATMAYQDENKVFHLNKEYADRYKMYIEPGLQTGYIRINMQDKLLGNNKALRQALVYALDTEAWIKLMRNSRGMPLNTIVPHPIAGSEADIGFKYYTQNIEMAKKKLEEAGYPGGKGLPPITIEYRATTTASRQDHEFLRNELAAIGVTLNGSFQTFSSFLQKIESGNFQMSDSGWGADFPDAENFYQLLYGPNMSPGPNEGNYENPVYDALYEKARFMANGPERFKLFTEMSEIIKEDVPVILRWNHLAFGLYQPRVKNMKRNMMADAPYKYLNLR